MNNWKEMTQNEMLYILDEIELSWETTKESCDSCIPDYLLEWAKKVRLLILKSIPTKKIKAKDLSKRKMLDICSQYEKIECEQCPLKYKKGIEIFGRKIDVCLKRKEFLHQLNREDLLETEVSDWKNE